MKIKVGEWRKLGTGEKLARILNAALENEGKRKSLNRKIG